MTALILTILGASLFGSLHCAGMCGAFALFAIGAGDPSVATSRTRLMAIYHLGRLLTYVALGALAGFVGSLVDFSGSLAGVGRVAALLAGAFMIAFGAVTLLRLAGVQIAHLRLPPASQTLITRLHTRAMRHSPPFRALATGLLTTLLPCGWLYAFVITAGGTGHAAAGALVMLVFWIGTLPALTGLGLGLQKLSGPLARRVPIVTASAIVAVGLYTVVARAHVNLQPMIRSPRPARTLVERVRAIDKARLPCCDTRPEHP